MKTVDERAKVKSGFKSDSPTCLVSEISARLHPLIREGRRDERRVRGVETADILVDLLGGGPRLRCSYMR